MYRTGAATELNEVADWMKSAGAMTQDSTIPAIYTQVGMFHNSMENRKTVV
jgi:hypothetical protein